MNETGPVGAIPTLDDLTAKTQTGEVEPGQVVWVTGEIGYYVVIQTFPGTTLKPVIMKTLLDPGTWELVRDDPETPANTPGVIDEPGGLETRWVDDCGEHSPLQLEVPGDGRLWLQKTTKTAYAFDAPPNSLCFTDLGLAPNGDLILISYQAPSRTITRLSRQDLSVVWQVPIANPVFSFGGQNFVDPLGTSWYWHAAGVLKGVDEHGNELASISGLPGNTTWIPFGNYNESNGRIIYTQGPNRVEVDVAAGTHTVSSPSGARTERQLVFGENWDCYLLWHLDSVTGAYSFRGTGGQSWSHTIADLPDKAYALADSAVLSTLRRPEGGVLLIDEVSNSHPRKQIWWLAEDGTIEDTVVVNFIGEIGASQYQRIRCAYSNNQLVISLESGTTSSVGQHVWGVMVIDEDTREVVRRPFVALGRSGWESSTKHPAAVILPDGRFASAVDFSVRLYEDIT